MADDRHDDDRQGRDRLPEGVRLVDAPLLQAQEDRHERRGQTAGDQDVEDQLREHERRVVGVELGRQAEGPGEESVAQEADGVRREREGREEESAARQEPVEEGLGGAEGARDAHDVILTGRQRPVARSVGATGRRTRRHGLIAQAGASAGERERTLAGPHESLQPCERLAMPRV